AGSSRRTSLRHLACSSCAASVIRHLFGTALVYRLPRKTLETTSELNPSPHPTPLQGEEPPVRTSVAADRFVRFLRIVFEPRAYGTALYLLLSFPLGPMYFVV